MRFNGIKAFNNSSIRTVAAARDALADARYEAEQRRGDADGETLIGKVNQWYQYMPCVYFFSKIYLVHRIVPSTILCKTWKWSTFF